MQAEALMYTLTNKSDTVFYNELIDKYPNTAIYLIIEQRSWYLDPSKLSLTICQAGPLVNKGHQDLYTIILKRKYFSTIAELLSTIINSMLTQVHELQNIFMSYIEPTLSTDVSQKSMEDICSAIRKMHPTFIPNSYNNKKTEISQFIASLVDNTLLINTAFNYISSQLNTICQSEINLPTIYRINNAYLSLTMNIKTFLSTYVSKLNPGSLFTLPHQLPILFTAATT